MKKAAELGLSIEFLKDVAAKSPTAFLNVMGETEKPLVESDLTKSSVNSEGLKRQNNVVLKEGTKAYFDNLRKTDPKTYWTPHTQQRIFEAAKRGTYL